MSWLDNLLSLRWLRGSADDLDAQLEDLSHPGVPVRDLRRAPRILAACPREAAGGTRLLGVSSPLRWRAVPHLLPAGRSDLPRGMARSPGPGLSLRDRRGGDAPRPVGPRAA